MYQKSVNSKILNINFLLKDKSNNTFVQLFRYTIVGVISFIFDFSTLFILTEYLNLHYLFSAAIAFLIGLTTNYLLSISWVFVKRSISSKYAEFFLFFAVGLIGLALNEVFIWSFTEIIGIYYLHSKIFSTILVYLWNFSLRKLLLF